MASSDCSKDPFFVCELGWVVRQYEQWPRLCPAITPFYAVKCNNDPVLLHTVSNTHSQQGRFCFLSLDAFPYLRKWVRGMISFGFLNGNFPISKIQMMILRKYAINNAFALASSRSL